MKDAPSGPELVRHLGGHALAVELSGIFLRNYPDESLSAYLQGLRSGRELDEDCAVEVRYRGTTTQAFAAIARTLDPATRGAWRTVAWFEADNIPHTLLDAAGIRARKRLGLAKWHLISHRGQGWTMHRLVAEYGCRYLGNARWLREARKAMVLGCIKYVENIPEEEQGRLPEHAVARSHLATALNIGG